MVASMISSTDEQERAAFMALLHRPSEPWAHRLHSSSDSALSRARTARSPKERRYHGAFCRIVEASCGISAFPMSSRVVHKMGLKEDPQNFLLMHTVGVNVSGQIASVIAGGLILSFFLK